MITIIGGDGKTYGPVPVDQVKRWMQEGRATLDTLARGEGQAEWRKLRELPEFAEAVGTPPPIVPPVTSTTPAEPMQSDASAVQQPDAAVEALRPESAPASFADASTAAPQAPAGPKLASRGIRLLAAIIDGILSMLFALPGMIMLSVQMVANGNRMPSLGTPAFMAAIAGIGVIFAGWVILMIIQFWLLTVKGQTVGKKLLGIRIVRVADGSNPGFVNAVLLRAVVTTILDNIPYLGLVFWFVDSCFIFRQDRRCIHDLIADTKVVDE